MRQLKGGRTKETRKEKRERKSEFMKAKQQFITYCLPALIIAGIFVVIYVYINSRPVHNDWNECSGKTAHRGKKNTHMKFIKSYFVPWTYFYKKDPDILINCLISFNNKLWNGVIFTKCVNVSSLKTQFCISKVILNIYISLHLKKKCSILVQGQVIQWCQAYSTCLCSKVDTKDLV